MLETPDATFDALAPDYDRLWTSSPVGMRQRNAFWQTVDPLFKVGERVLDLGCGTGVDALHLQAAGVRTVGIDSSPKMIGIARQRDIDARLLPIEDIASLPGEFDGAISNFGALNCVRDLDLTAAALAKLVRRGGHIALCFLGRVCAWEVCYYLFHGNPRKAFRRFWGRCESYLAKDGFYFASSAIISAFEPDFRLRRRLGIGLCIPPSYVGPLSAWLMTGLAEADSRLAHWPVLRALSDHSLYVFERL
jgi:SAM-dependent methyltransferase